MKLYPLASSLATLLLAAAMGGCSLCPEKLQRDRIHNPFPQLKRVAVLPFYNQSSEPTIDTELVAEKYYAALQAIPGFEVLPVGVTKAQWLQFARIYGEPKTGRDFQQLAKQMGVEALVVGSVTDFDAYYPPRMAMTVHWYAANEGFHPIPTGYGLPWGTEHEKHIPRRIAHEAEFELARSQLATQTPLTHLATTEFDSGDVSKASGHVEPHGPAGPPSASDPFADNSFAQPRLGSEIADDQFHSDLHVVEHPHGTDGAVDPQLLAAPLPANWPESTDLIPDPPSPHRPLATVSHEPVLTHTRLFRGDDPYFTGRLATHVESGDDARPGSWQGYLKRSDDFIHFCCHLHITEMLESRGGSDQSDLILRWPLSRY